MVIHKSLPMYQITTSYGGSNYTFTNDQFISGRVIRLENGFDTAVLWLNDYQSRNFLSKMDAGSTVTIEFKDGSDAAYTTELSGVIRFINEPSSATGELLELQCDGKGYGFGETICTEEYGSESVNSTLDTLREILNTATSGIVDGYVNNMFTDNVTDTGYSYTSDNNTCEDIAGEIKYLYFPGVPNTVALKTLCDVVQAIKGANAGPHWIVDTSGNLLVCTVNASHPTAGYGWTKYFGDSQANATLVQGVDFKESNFQKMAKEANYILYHGAFKRPSNGDFWTENNSGLWTKAVDVTLSDDNAIYRVGSYSLKGTTVFNGAESWMQYPSAGNMSVDVTKLTGRHNIPTLNFSIRRNTEVSSVHVVLGFGGAFSAYRYLTLTTDQWSSFSFPIGPYAYTVEDQDPWHFSGLPTPWNDLDHIDFHWSNAANNNSKEVYVDGLNISGWVLRGARQAAAYSATDPMKGKVITDNVAKDDALVTATDTGTIARLAKAELLRCQTTPTIGWVKTPWLYTLLPGQLLHIHAKKKADGTFNVDADMRVTRLEHDFSVNGFTTISHLTSDVTNSYARTSFTDSNIIAQASKDWGNRQAISIKTREYDITQPIMENSY